MTENVCTRLCLLAEVRELADRHDAIAPTSAPRIAQRVSLARQRKELEQEIERMDAHR